MAVDPVVANAVEQSNPVAGSILAEPPTPQSATSTPSTSAPSGVEGGASVAPESPQAGIESTPEEKPERKVNVDKFPAAAKKDFNNPDLPLAKAAMWNAFFTGLAKGGVSDAIAEAGNAYGRSLTKFADKEADYLSQRRIINQQATDNIKDTLDSFDSGDEYTNSVVKNYGTNPEMLTKLSDDLASRGELAASKKVKDVIEQVKQIDDTRRQDLLTAAGSLTGGGNVQKVDVSRGYATIGGKNTLVTAIDTVSKNNKVTTQYKWTDPNNPNKQITSATAPEGFQLATTFNAQQAPGIAAARQFQAKELPKIADEGEAAQKNLDTLVAPMEQILADNPDIFGALRVTGASSATINAVANKLADNKASVSREDLSVVLGISPDDPSFDRKVSDFQTMVALWEQLRAASIKKILGESRNITDQERDQIKQATGDITKMDAKTAKRLLDTVKFDESMKERKAIYANDYNNRNPSGSAIGFNAEWNQEYKRYSDEFNKNRRVAPVEKAAKTSSSNPFL